MTFGPKTALVGAVFPNREAAGQATADLRSSGFGDDQLASAEWLEGRYVIASHAGRQMGRSLFWGGVIGTIVGAIVGAVLTLILWQAASVAVALVVGAVAGGTIGGFLGAYIGLNRHRPQLWDQQDWEHIEIGNGEVLIVMAEKERPELVNEILERHGGRQVEPARPQ